jgi:hypothetical protein
MPLATFRPQNSFFKLAYRIFAESRRRGRQNATKKRGAVQLYGAGTPEFLTSKHTLIAVRGGKMPWLGLAGAKSEIPLPDKKATTALRPTESAVQPHSVF